MELWIKESGVKLLTGKLKELISDMRSGKKYLVNSVPIVALAYSTKQLIKIKCEA
jgi:hypothetical protein